MKLLNLLRRAVGIAGDSGTSVNELEPLSKNLYVTFEPVFLRPGDILELKYRDAQSVVVAERTIVATTDTTISHAKLEYNLRGLVESLRKGNNG